MCIRDRNRPDNFFSYSPDNHHCSDDVYLREGGLMTKTGAAWSAHVQSNSLVLQLSLVVRLAGENLAVGVFFNLPLHLLRLTHVLTKLFLRLNAQPSTVNSWHDGNASPNILRGVYPLGNPLISNLCSILYGQDTKEWRFLGLTGLMYHNVWRPPFSRIKWDSLQAMSPSAVDVLTPLWWGIVT